MVLVDAIWTGIFYAFILVFAAIIGFVVLKVGIVSFKVAMGTIMAAREIENIKGVVRHPYGVTEEDDDEFEIITSYIRAKIKENYYANYYTKYIYDLFEIKLILSYIDSLKNFIDARTEENNYSEYAYEMFKIEKILSFTDSLKNFIRNKTRKNDYTKYAYMQLFKK